MFINIISSIIFILGILIVFYYTRQYKEGFFDFPDENHNDFVKDSQTKFNELTSSLNIVNPSIPITPDSNLNINLALKGFTAKPDGDKYTLEPISTSFTIPNTPPQIIEQAKHCESYGPSCDAFNDPTFATNCGMSFDNKSTGIDGKIHVGGLYVSQEDRQSQIAAADNVTKTGAAPFDPYKVFQPTIGTASPGTFALTKEQCTIVKERVDCQTKQTFNSPNCAQCYTTQNFYRVDPSTPRIPSTLFLSGNGTVLVWTSNTPSENTIAYSETPLSIDTPLQVNIPDNAEGTIFTILVKGTDSQYPPHIAGYLQSQTARGTFKLDLIHLVKLDTTTNSKPHINGTLLINGFNSVSIVPGSAQTTINLSCIMPFSFLNVYNTDVLSCDNGPIVTKASSATFLESDPCFGKNNTPGNYGLECLQSRWIQMGGTQKGSGYPSNKSTADAIQIDSTGKPLDIDTIINNLSIKISQALTGKDSNGIPLSLADWNSLSLWATGIPINTPCDGPSSTNGPLSQECLSYLYTNSGTTSHIGPTYTLTPSQVASMKGQNNPNTYCQPGTSIDPSTASGLTFGQTLGGITAVKQTYDQINRLANDNTKSNSQRADAIKKCYGVNLNSLSSDNVSGPVQVFAVGPGYNYTQEQAKNVCSQYGAVVATTTQLEESQKNGADWCFTGWVADSTSAMYPITTSIQSGCGGGTKGVMNYTPPNNKAGVNCYGPKPGIDVYPSGTILPFNGTLWDKPDDSTTTYSSVTNGYFETSGPQPSCFSGLSVEQAEKTCTSLGTKCAGFSYANDSSGSGCYKGDLKGGFRNISGYSGYIKNPQQ
jgi:hypothetical protein